MGASIAVLHVQVGVNLRGKGYGASLGCMKYTPEIGVGMSD
jgi:hypothetical protein